MAKLSTKEATDLAVSGGIGGVIDNVTTPLAMRFVGNETLARAISGVTGMSLFKNKQLRKGFKAQVVVSGFTVGKSMTAGLLSGVLGGMTTQTAVATGELF